MIISLVVNSQLYYYYHDVGFSLSPERVGLIVCRLPIVCFPRALPELHIREDSSKRGVFRRAGIYSNPHFARPFVDMADAHLPPLLSVFGTFDTIVIFTAREAIPHHLLMGRDSGCCPIAITMIGNYASQMLKLAVFELHRCFKPVVAIEVHYHTALVKACMAATKVGSHHKRKKLFICLHLEDGSIIVTEMVVGALP